MPVKPLLVQDIISFLHAWAPPSFAADYDNVGLQIGNVQKEVSGILTTLDCTEQHIKEAISKGLNVIVAHHPVMFKGYKSITGKHYTERIIIKAIKNDINIIAVHTNLDSLPNGVNFEFANKLGLEISTLQILEPQANLLSQLSFYFPLSHTQELELLKDALFQAGAGNISNYSECAFTSTGTGTFKGNEKSNPQVGDKGKRETVQEVKIEMLAYNHSLPKLISVLKEKHIYEEVAYQIIPLKNEANIGSGMIGKLAQPVAEDVFTQHLKEVFKVPVVRRTALLNKPIQTVALCGGSGAFLINKAKAKGADWYITADVKYHDFFEADNKIVIADIGHFETEQFTAELLHRELSEKFSNIAVFFSELHSNPIIYA